MPGRSSIVFTRFTAESPKLAAWKQHSARVVGLGYEPAPDDRPVARSADLGNDGIIVWHLKSANNRMLGKSAGTFPTFEDASVVAAQFIDAHEDLKQRLVSQGPRLAYGWFAALDGVALVTCARWYATERDRRNSFALALGQLDSADIGQTARLIPTNYHEGKR